MATLAEKHVLAVDDEGVMLKMYRDYFARQGVPLRTASSAAETLALVEAQPADIIIMDLKLGDDSGRDVLAKVRARHPDTRWIFVTAYATDQLVKELYGSGVFEVIKKPCTIRTIFETVEKLALSSLGTAAPIEET
jgi:DNA-binding NtrC family response regulator